VNPRTNKGNSTNRCLKSQSGFTLNEILVTLLIVACVGALATVSYNMIISNAEANRVAQCIESATAIKSAYLDSPARTAAQRDAWDKATEDARMATLVASGANINGTPITSGTDLTMGTGFTSITLGDSTTDPTIP